MYKYFETKYYVNEEQAASARRALDSLYGGTDPFGKGRIQSIYYDSSDEKSFHECLGGENLKRKFRMRTYDGKIEGVFQIKEKNLNMVRKYRVPFNYQTCRGTLTPGAFAATEHPDRSAVTGLVGQYHQLQPVIEISYERHRYRIFDYRISFDTDMKFKALARPWLWKRKSGRLKGAVLEIKSLLERPLLPFLGFIKLQQTSFSKFLLSNLALRDHQPILFKKYAD